MLTFTRSIPEELHRWKVEEMKAMLEDMKGIVQLRLHEIGRERKRAEREQQEWEEQQKWEAQELLVTQQEQRLEELENWKREWNSWDTIDQDNWKEILIEMQRKQLQETRDRIAWERLTSESLGHQTQEFKEWTQKSIRLDQKEVYLEQEYKKRLQGLAGLEELDLRELDLLANIWLKWQENELQQLDGDTLDQLKHRARWSGPKLLDKIIANESSFMARSPYLNALLIFAGLFSGIVSAFLIDIRKGLQEDILLEILHQLRLKKQLELENPIKPTLVSIWVNKLWFSSFTTSMMAALIVMLAKSLGRWVISKKEAETIFHSPEYPRRRYREIQRIYVHSIFEQKLTSLTNTASAFIYIAVIFFFAGLAVLVFTTQNSSEISFLMITSTMGTLIFGVTFHYFYAYA